MDNFIVSARKYRPATFQQVVGQLSITSTLQNAIKNNHLAQAFLFTGPRGVGKTTCARILAKTINCENLTDKTEPCNQCKSCISFNNSASFNVHELDAASNNSVDDIRSLVDQVRIPPQVGRYKVYIIDEVHMLSQAAFNAFLKTLEEPPAYAKFILATTEKHKILPTILSRCQLYDFRRIQVEDITKHLAYVAQNEGVDAEEEALHIIAQKSDGALRDALSTFDQIASYSGDQITYKNVIENLNILDYEYYFKVTDYLIYDEISNALLIFNEVIENGFDGQHFITGLNEHLRNLLVVKDASTMELLLASPSIRERYAAQADKCSPQFLLKAMEICNSYDLSYKTSNNKRLHIEIALMQLTQIGDTDVIQKRVPTETPQVRTRQVHEKNPSYTKAVEEKTEEMQPEPASIPSTKLKKEDPAQHAVLRQEDKTEPQAEHPLQSDQAKEPPDNTTAKNEGNGRKIKNISIKNSLDALKKQKDVEVDDDVPEIRTAFDQQKLDEIWNGFATTYQAKSPSFAHAIGKYKPVLKEDFVIEYEVDNNLIAKDILNVTSLLEYLKSELNNNQITLKAVVPDNKKEKIAYTDREKFEKMAKKYPGIVGLKDSLNLELEF